jgi:hypothetical protein
VAPPTSGRQVLHVARQWLWFLWPAWLLALWALWQWRRHLMRRHLSIPLTVLATALVACLLMGGSDRALLLGLPGVAVLAAFALPTLRRSTGSAIDWFSVFFFSLLAFAVWVVYVAMQSGVPAKVAANVIKLAPGFVPQFSALALIAAIAATAAWLWLVRWRTARHRAAIWRSLVLPAGGVALAWLLLMTLWLPLLDYARSYRALVTRIAEQTPREVCVAAPDVPAALIASLEYMGGYRVDAVTPADLSPCEILLRTQRGDAADELPGWSLAARLPRPTAREDITLLYRRAAR